MTQEMLGPDHVSIFAGFALSNVLVGLDYDGTLAPIAPTPRRARMRTETRDLLAAVARLYPCVVISGRALDDLARRLDGIPLWYLFGNHGLEPAAPRAPHTALVREWVQRLTAELPPELGVTVEDKTHSVTIHYRQAPDKRKALHAVDIAVSRLPGARALGGSEAVSVLPADGPDKGIALQQARRIFACDTAIYVGDDDTDETAFRSADADRLLGIRIGATDGSCARYHLRSQDDIDELLRLLRDLRSTDAGRQQSPRV